MNNGNSGNNKNGVFMVEQEETITNEHGVPVEDCCTFFAPAVTDWSVVIVSTPRENEIMNFAPAVINHSVTGFTPRKNEIHSNGVLLQVTGITPRKFDIHIPDGSIPLETAFPGLIMAFQ